MKKESLVKILSLVKKEFHSKIEELDKQYEKFFTEENIDTEIDLEYQEKYNTICNEYKPIIREISNELGLDD